jgi:hypothetical protein
MTIASTVKSIVISHGLVKSASQTAGFCWMRLLSTSDARVHFGLGRSDTVELLEIRWPSRVVQTLTGVKPDQILTVREPVKKISAKVDR